MYLDSSNTGDSYKCNSYKKRLHKFRTFVDVPDYEYKFFTPRKQIMIKRFSKEHMALSSITFNATVNVVLREAHRYNFHLTSGR